MSDKIYVGSGKVINSQYGEFLSVSLCLDDLFKASKDGYGSEYNGKKYIKVNINKKREVDQYGKSHAVTVDTWRPGGDGQDQNDPPF